MDLQNVGPSFVKTPSVQVNQVSDSVTQVLGFKLQESEQVSGVNQVGTVK